VLAAGAWAGHFRDLSAELRATASPARVINIVASDEQAVSDPDIGPALKGVSDANTPAHRAAFAEKLKAMIDLRAMTEEPAAASTNLSNAGSNAKAIKESIFYRDPGVAEQGNWLGKALERLRNLTLNLKQPNVDMPKFTIGPWIIKLLWTLLAIGLLVLVYLGVRQLDWKRRTSRRTKAVLEEDEPEQSVDEWLATADRLTAEGRYREAVRALYLACLLRFDEYRIARFDRHETNWEHLNRIHRSPKRPSELDFTTATKAFDRIWYGKDTEGLPDVERFRGWYAEYLGILREARV
jgi:hypothetical protein